MISNLIVRMLSDLPFEIKGAKQVEVKQETRPAEPLSANGSGQANGTPAAVYIPHQFAHLSEQLPSFDSAQLTALLRIMVAGNIPFELEHIRTIYSFLFGPPLSERMHALFFSLPPAAFQEFPFLPELRGKWGKVLESYQLEKIAQLGKEKADGELLQWMRFASESLRDESIIQRYPQAKEAVRDLILWLTAQSHLLRQTNESATPLFYHFQLPVTYRKEDTPSFVEVTGRRKGKGIDAEQFSLYLSIALPVLGEIALRLYLVERKASLFLFFNHADGNRLLAGEKERLGQDLSALGYRMGELLWLPHSGSGKRNGIETNREVSFFDRQF